MSTGLGPLPPHVAAPDPSIYLGNNYVVLDFETTNADKGSALNDANRIILACWQVGCEGVRHLFGSEYEQIQLVAEIESADFIVAHNAKFELQWLSRCGIDLYNIVCYDTYLGEWVIGGNRWRQQHLSLDACLARRKMQGKGSTVSWMIKQGFPVEDIPKRWLLDYCKQDVIATHELFLRQRKELQEKELLPIAYARNLVVPALADIESNGMQLDEAEVFKLETKQEERYVRLTNQLTEITQGVDPSKAVQLARHVYTELGFKPPRDHRGRPMLTPKGSPSVAAPIMEKLVAKTKKQQDFLDLYREWAQCNSDLTKYLRKLGDCCRDADGLLYGSINQGTSRTHRFSSSGKRYRVQLQNIQRTLKPAFRSREDSWSVGEADGAQLEFRTAVHLGRDKVGLRYIVDPESDIHKFTASEIFDILESDVSRDQRQDAKEHSFKPLYGGESGTEAEQRYYRAFKNKYKGIADTQTGWLQHVLRHKALTTEWGMRYYWPDTKLQPSGYITNTTNIYNYPVQAFATAEIIPLALVAAWHRMREARSFLINTVHDSLIAEVHPAEHELWHSVARRCLIEDAYGLIASLYGIQLTVPLGAGVMLSSRWGDKEAKDSEVVYEAPDALWLEAAQKEGMI